MCGPFTYTFQVNPNAPFIEFNARTITIFTQSPSFLGEYSISIEGQIPNGLNSEVVFALHVLLDINEPPYFIAELKDQRVEAGKKVEYILPQYKDN